MLTEYSRNNEQFRPHRPDFCLRAARSKRRGASEGGRGFGAPATGMRLAAAHAHSGLPLDPPGAYRAERRGRRSRSPGLRAPFGRRKRRGQEGAAGIAPCPPPHARTLHRLRGTVPSERGGGSAPEEEEEEEFPITAGGKRPSGGSGGPATTTIIVMLRLRLLTWDVKDTLIRLRLPVGESYSAGARASGLRVPAEALDASFRKAHRAQSQRFPNYGLDKGLDSKQWWLDVVLETFRLSGVQDEGLLWPLAEKLYRDYSSPDNWELLPAARETLGRCQQLGIPMAVVSNFDRRLPYVLTRCGLRQHFAFVLSSEEAGFAKPDKRIFQKALRIAGVPPRLAAHVGDNYENDYRAAREAGMHSFLLQGAAGQLGDRQVEVPPGHLLDSLSELPSRIERG